MTITHTLNNPIQMMINRFLMAILKLDTDLNGWRHLNQAIWPEVCITHLKVLTKNNSRTKRRNLAKFTSWLTFSHISLSQKNHYKMKMIPIILKKAESSNKTWGEILAQVTSGLVTFLFPAFEPGIRCSRNGGSPVNWIISLYLWYQV